MQTKFHSTYRGANIYRHDRTYWRGETAERLIEEGKASGDELAIALAERLEDKDRNLEAVRDELHRHMREDD